jgi:hypothetical protein
MISSLLNISYLALALLTSSTFAADPKQRANQSGGGKIAESFVRSFPKNLVSVARSDSGGFYVPVGACLQNLASIDFRQVSPEAWSYSRGGGTSDVHESPINRIEEVKSGYKIQFGSGKDSVVIERLPENPEVYFTEQKPFPRIYLMSPDKRSRLPKVEVKSPPSGPGEEDGPC